MPSHSVFQSRENHGRESKLMKYTDYPQILKFDGLRKRLIGNIHLYISMIWSETVYAVTPDFTTADKWISIWKESWQHRQCENCQYMTFYVMKYRFELIHFRKWRSELIHFAARRPKSCKSRTWDVDLRWYLLRRKIVCRFRKEPSQVRDIVKNCPDRDTTMYEISVQICIKRRTITPWRIIYIIVSSWHCSRHGRDQDPCVSFRHRFVSAFDWWVHLTGTHERWRLHFQILRNISSDTWYISTNISRQVHSLKSMTRN